LSRVRWLLPATSILLSLVGAAPAFAGHLQGGYFTADVTVGGRLQGTVTYLERIDCPMGVGSQTPISIRITSPAQQSVTETVPGVATRCLPGSSTYVGSFDIPLDSSKFSLGAPDGAYTLQWASSARVNPIVNLGMSSGAVIFRAKVRKVANQATGAPFLGSNVATGIGIGSDYAQNLNASDPDGGALSYTTLNAPADPDAPASDIITLSNTGLVKIPADVTSTFTRGQYYVYKVRVTDDQGDYAERDVLLKVGGPNKTPAISGLQSTPYEIEAGKSRTITFSANDADATNTVTISGAGLPSWATLTTTPGNPAQATLQLDPPADVAAKTYGMNFDAVDNDVEVPLTGSANIQVVVAEPDTTPPVLPADLVLPDEGAHLQSLSVTFGAQPDGERTQCSVDDGEWVDCTSPFQPSGLAEGEHTIAVRAIDDAGNVSEAIESRTVTLDTSAPQAPELVQAPAALASTSRFELAAEEGAIVECSLDGGEWVECDSPFEPAGLADGAHVVEVRAVDAAGNTSEPAVHEWTLDTVAPSAVTVLAGPSGSTEARDATFEFAGEPDAVFECRVDGGAWAMCTSPVRLSGLAEGEHTLEVRQIDGAGNVSAVSKELWTVVRKAEAPAQEQAPREEAPRKATAVLTSAIAVQGDTAGVGCRIAGADLDRCAVRAYITLPAGKGGRAHAPRRVLIGTGRAVAVGPTRRLAVHVRLNSAGRRYVNRLGGVRVVFEVDAKPVSGPTIHAAARKARLLPQRLLAMPSSGLFASGSSSLRDYGLRYVTRIAKQLRGAKAIQCVGHTDSVGDAGANLALGQRRAASVCAGLRAAGVRVATRASSAGESQPRATNLTGWGRSLNRRVELVVRYR
jgi:outer membrane protein OmpA-like peptidoglycan-associated protein